MRKLRQREEVTCQRSHSCEGVREWSRFKYGPFWFQHLTSTLHSWSHLPTVDPKEDHTMEDRMQRQRETENQVHNDTVWGMGSSLLPHNQTCIWATSLYVLRQSESVFYLQRQCFLIDSTCWQKSSPSLQGLLFYEINYDILVNMHIFYPDLVTHQVF